MGNIEEGPHRNQWGYFLNNRGVLKIQRVSHFGRMYIQHFQAWNICPSDYCEKTWGGRMSSQPDEPPQLVLLFWGTPLLKQPFPVWQSAKNHRKAGIFIDTPSVPPVETHETQLIRVFCGIWGSISIGAFASFLGPIGGWRPLFQLLHGGQLPNFPTYRCQTRDLFGWKRPVSHVPNSKRLPQNRTFPKRIVSQLSSFRGVWKRLC